MIYMGVLGDWKLALNMGMIKMKKAIREWLEAHEGVRRWGMVVCKRWERQWWGPRVVVESYVDGIWMKPWLQSSNFAHQTSHWMYCVAKWVNNGDALTTHWMEFWSQHPNGKRPLILECPHTWRPIYPILHFRCPLKFPPSVQGITLYLSPCRRLLIFGTPHLGALPYTSGTPCPILHRKCSQNFRSQALC